MKRDAYDALRLTALVLNGGVATATALQWWTLLDTLVRHPSVVPWTPFTVLYLLGSLAPIAAIVALLNRPHDDLRH